jgi:hypothetical protein
VIPTHQPLAPKVWTIMYTSCALTPPRRFFQPANDDDAPCIKCCRQPAEPSEVSSHSRPPPMSQRQHGGAEILGPCHGPVHVAPGRFTRQNCGVWMHAAVFRFITSEHEHTSMLQVRRD